MPDRGDRALGRAGAGSHLQPLDQRPSSSNQVQQAEKHLEEAVAAYRGALQEYIRDRVPLDWAGTQSNLGNAPVVLGERESGTAHLEEAVAAYRAALEGNTRDRVPLNRDVILLAEPDEEVGGALGARWMIANHWDELDPEYVIDEGGFGSRELFAA